MSNLLGAALSSMAYISDTNYSDWSANLTIKRALLPLKMIEQVGPRGRPPSYENPFWPGGAGLQGAQGADGPILSELWWDSIEMYGGCGSRYGVNGITRDQYGQILGGVTVKLFYTGLTTFALPADTVVDSTVSDVNTGYYFVTTPYYPDAHYIVTYKSGSPDVFGTSPNSLIAS